MSFKKNKMYGLAMLILLMALPGIAMDKTAASITATPKTDTASTNVTLEKPNTNANALTDTSKPIIVQQKNNQKNVTFTIRLAANNTTGFQWFLTGYDANLVTPSRSGYETNTNKLIGSPGVSVWEFQLKPIAFLVPHITHIQFEYRRPWLATFGNRQSFTIITEPANKQSDNSTKTSAKS